MEADVMLNTAGSYTEWIDPTDADYTARRLYWLQLLQEVFDEVWNYRPWPWKLRNDQITVPLADGFEPMPEDYQELGEQGGVYLVGSADGWPLEEVSPQQIQGERASGAGATSTPDHFAIFGFDVATGLPLIQLPPLGSAVNLDIWFYANPTLLVDDSTSSGLTDIPLAYHQTVLLAGLVAKLRRNKGDDRDWQALFDKGLAWMVTREKPRKNTPRSMPRSMIGQW